MANMEDKLSYQIHLHNPKNPLKSDPFVHIRGKMNAVSPQYSRVLEETNDETTPTGAKDLSTLLKTSEVLMKIRQDFESQYTDLRKRLDFFRSSPEFRTFCGERSCLTALTQVTELENLGNQIIKNRQSLVNDLVESERAYPIVADNQNIYSTIQQRIKSLDGFTTDQALKEKYNDCDTNNKVIGLRMLFSKGTRLRTAPEASFDIEGLASRTLSDLLVTLEAFEQRVKTYREKFKALSDRLTLYQSSDGFTHYACEENCLRALKEVDELEKTGQEIEKERMTLAEDFFECDRVHNISRTLDPESIKELQKRIDGIGWNYPSCYIDSCYYNKPAELREKFNLGIRQPSCWECIRHIVG